MTDDPWAALAGSFLGGAYASAKGYVRTVVLDRQLRDHLRPPPGAILDVGGGAGHQSFPLAERGYDVTLLDSSPAMLAQAAQHQAALAPGPRGRVRLLAGEAESAQQAVAGQLFDAVVCHGVLGYLDSPDAVVSQLCQCAAPGGLVSIMTANARAMAVRPALERRFADALAAFDSRREVGVLGVPQRADTVEELSDLLDRGGVDPVAWYGVWLFADWLEFSGVPVDPGDPDALAALAAVEYEASHRDPYRQMSRVFHLIGVKRGGGSAAQPSSPWRRHQA